MPAVTADTLTLPRLPRLPETGTAWRPVAKTVTARRHLEGEGFVVRRPFPGMDLSLADPFLLLDHMGAVEYAPGEAKGTPWHPHRGFETVTYVIDGALEHQDTTGGGGLITDGATQWMTAGSGIQHIETPPEHLVARGGLFHGVQLWVNLPRAQKWVPPRYQDIKARDVALVAGADGASLVRVIAGELAGHTGPGVTYTPITYLHATVAPGSRLALPWPRDFNALVYVLAGRGFVGPERRPLEEGQLAVFGPGDALIVQAADTQPLASRDGWEVLVLGGLPIREPIARYGPFVMNTRAEIIQAIEDYQAGRMGVIPPVPHRTSADESLPGGSA
ncbi:pirin family protein [Carbonactinospora thermoautotrophica]|uniref:Pirin n=2 Tax=Carbonactinospora thermoautotrophica TaxID=1469144 RepID=A0A132MW47_9ACTN|nr:pirin family protein [Carbonactinospora thermoautotrophica]KWX00029.1 pirin [Carbonactinospora thermoautotrophica]KWX02063.1 Pirin domain protein [Carbonactinospora thermoautotrophica]MCX9189987.1 pirin family protein [Carbonactinospora thermoautotrophica]